MKRVYKTIGLMSGTSIDGVDAALIETDGYEHVKPLAFLCQPYTEEEREQIRACFGRRDRDSEDVKDVERFLTLKHAGTVKELLRQKNLQSSEVDLVGFHGQTIFHAPEERLTIQIGDGALLAAETGIDTVYDFRSADVAAGGQGAPLAPVYHQAMAKSSGLNLPIVVLNIGGVANVTWIGRRKDELLAFDTGPGNALMDDFIQKRTGQRYDENGALAAQGKVNGELLSQWMQYSYFQQKPPKSLDRNEWDIAALGPVVEKMNAMSTEDGLATLSAFTVQGILKSLDFMPEPPKTWYAAGGGRHNQFLMHQLRQELDLKNAGMLENIDILGWNGDATEAECFAYLAVRSVLKEPISFPLTTGVAESLTGGILACLH